MYRIKWIVAIHSSLILSSKSQIKATLAIGWLFQCKNLSKNKIIKIYQVILIIGQSKNGSIGRLKSTYVKRIIKWNNN